MKRVPLASRQSRALGDEIRVGFKHQSLLQDYLELQKVRAFIYLFIFLWVCFSSLLIEDLGFRISCLLVFSSIVFFFFCLIFL